MKSLDRAITRFCYKHPRFGIPNLMLYVVICSAVTFILTMMDRTRTLLLYLAFDPSLILKGQVWRLLTFLFLPYDDNIFLVAISLYFYYFIGSSLERQWGTGRFTIYYFTGVVMNVLFGFLTYYIPALFGHSHVLVWLDPVYLNMSLFFAFASIWPEQRVLLFFFIPVKMKWLAIADAAFFLLSILLNIADFPFNLLPLVAILNFFIFCGSDLLSGLRRGRAASRSHRSWDRAVRSAQRERASQPYRHKCSVCGRTDVTNPELEFRYCSRCAGYHCFCQDHINDHVHFTE